MDPLRNGGMLENLSSAKPEDREGGAAASSGCKSSSATNRVSSSPPEYKGIRNIIRNFTPSWFAVTMGTGIVSILLHNLPYNGTWIYWVSVIFFILNVILFVTFFVISVARYAMYPEIWRVMICHPTQSLFLGTFPMGLATIINMVVFVCVPAWGPHAIALAWALWWLDVVIAVMVCFWMPFMLYVTASHLTCNIQNGELTS